MRIFNPNPCQTREFLSQSRRTNELGLPTGIRNLFRRYHHFVSEGEPTFGVKGGGRVLPSWLSHVNLSGLPGGMQMVPTFTFSCSSLSPKNNFTLSVDLINALITLSRLDGHGTEAPLIQDAVRKFAAGYKPRQANLKLESLSLDIALFKNPEFALQEIYVLRFSFQFHDTELNINGLNCNEPILVFLHSNARKAKKLTSD